MILSGLKILTISNSEKKKSFMTLDPPVVVEVRNPSLSQIAKIHKDPLSKNVYNCLF